MAGAHRGEEKKMRFTQLSTCFNRGKKGTDLKPALQQAEDRSSKAIDLKNASRGAHSARRHENARNGGGPSGRSFSLYALYPMRAVLSIRKRLFGMMR